MSLLRISIFAAWWQLSHTNSSFLQDETIFVQSLQCSDVDWSTYTHARTHTY
jgi:hypothetical protein